MPVIPNRVMKRLLKRPHELAYNCSLHRGRLKDASFSAGTGLMASHPSAFRGRAQPVDATLYLRWKDGVYSVISEESRLSVSSQAHLNKW
jgi:hypothetical protein